jgi:iron-sulfur cluster assembly protein
MSVEVQEASAIESNITFSDTAVKHIESYLAKSKEYQGIRLSVKKTGCSGMSYVVDYVSLPKEGDINSPLIGEYRVYIDKLSYPFIKNMHVDYVKQGLNYKFIFNNPNQTGQCGCGESFTVEDR